MIRAKFPHLYQFFGSYFHQDWDLSGSDANAVIQTYLRENPSHSSLQPIIDEIEQLLKEPQNSLLEDLGCEYDPAFEGMSELEWLRWVQTSLKNGILSRQL